MSMTSEVHAEDFAALAAGDNETTLFSLQHGLDAEARASLPTDSVF